MSNGFLSKIGRALSIFGVSSPEDVRRMQARKAPAATSKPAPEAEKNRGEDSSAPQEKRTEEE